MLYRWGDPREETIKWFDADGTVWTIPLDPGNTAYQDFLRWCEEGNVPGPYLVPTVIDMIEDLVVAKEVATNSVRSTAYSLLQPTDWVVVREMETGAAVSEEITTYRAAVRTTSAEKVTMIEASDSIDDLQTYLRSEEFASWPESPAA